MLLSYYLYVYILFSVLTKGWAKRFFGVPLLFFKSDLFLRKVLHIESKFHFTVRRVTVYQTNGLNKRDAVFMTTVE